ncbi:hypothetical protein [Alkalihalobacillus sp. AL-G]|uniref:hypothetical protein n=1 Tax=Alkalihalobacillus sp. AL-G TaxID=2926399 RepID=UPI00272D0CFD|nr:hypothetical protein [Alkalihalobacillus sp. AL-G]WLD94744.1 hypothetical protein MOJ78_07640 [Alkalihalobacillus sp. AL-G]
MQSDDAQRKGNSFFIRTEAHFTLNFLVYIHNIFLNQRSSEADRFPYWSYDVKFVEEGTFQIAFNEKWNYLIGQLAEQPKNDQLIFYENSEFFYKGLFQETKENEAQFIEIKQSFLIWWKSFAGCFVIERTIDNHLHEKVYQSLTAAVIQSGKELKGELQISLVYDKVHFAVESEHSYFAVLPISDFYLSKNDLLDRLQNCIN